MLSCRARNPWREEKPVNRTRGLTPGPPGAKGETGEVVGGIGVDVAEGNPSPSVAPTARGACVPRCRPRPPGRRPSPARSTSGTTPTGCSPPSATRGGSRRPAGTPSGGPRRGPIPSSARCTGPSRSPSTNLTARYLDKADTMAERVLDCGRALPATPRTVQGRSRRGSHHVTIGKGEEPGRRDRRACPTVRE